MNNHNDTTNDNQSMATELSMPIDTQSLIPIPIPITYDTLPQVNDPQQQTQQRINEDQIRLYNMKKLAKSIPLPTTDAEIKLKLREIGEPIILFGEKPYERSDRLRQSIESLIIKHKGIPEFLYKSISHINTQPNEEFYTEGPPGLLEARKKILMYSLPRSAHRIALAKHKFLNYNKEEEEKEHNALFDSLKQFEFTLAQIGDDRGCSRGMLSPNGTVYGVAGWSGICSIFSIDNLMPVTKLIGHSDRVNSIAFHPNYGDEATIDLKGPCALTASDDCTIRLWSMDMDKAEQKSLVFKGHEHKVNNAEYHPMGTLIGSCSTDKTIRLWDIVSRKELLLQEGHSYSINCLSFQSDGALLASADYGGIGLVWDLRTGRTIASLLGHAKGISALKFSTNCYQVATGSDDNTVRIWDLRKNASLCTIPAHTDMVTDIYFEPGNGRYMVTCSFDSTVKFWNVKDWSLIKTYEANEDKVLSVGMNKERRKMITCSYGKTVKLWDVKEAMDE